MATPTTYYSGIDLHKKTTFITTLNAEGEMIAQQKLRNHPEVLRRYFPSIRARIVLW